MLYLPDIISFSKLKFPPTNIPFAFPSFIVLYSSSACPNTKPPSTNLFITSSYPYCVCQEVSALKVGPLKVTTPV